MKRGLGLNRRQLLKAAAAGCCVQLFGCGRERAADALVTDVAQLDRMPVARILAPYYLPYRLAATPEQFRRAYPEARRFAAIKRDIDPRQRFRNRLWDKYLRI